MTKKNPTCWQFESFFPCSLYIKRKEKSDHFSSVAGVLLPLLQKKKVLHALFISLPLLSLPTSKLSFAPLFCTECRGCDDRFV